MDELKIEDIVSEYKIKDLGSKNLKKLQKESDKSVKSIQMMEKQAKKTDTVLSRFGKRFKGVSAGRAARGGAAAVGGLSQGLGGLPIVGGLLAAVIASIQSVKNQFVTGLALKKELLALSTDVQTTFGKKSKQALRVFDKSFSFRTQQLQLLSGLTTRGVQRDQLEPENLKILETFAKAQGKDLENVFEGIVKSGRGLNDIQKLQAQQYIQLIKSQNPFEVRQGYDLLIKLLKNSSTELEKYAKQNKVVTNGVQSYTTATKRLQERQDLFFVRNAKQTREGFKAFKTGLESEKLIKNLTARVSGASTFVIEKASKAFNLLVDDEKPPGRAAGGPVSKGNTYMVGERGPELFKPRDSGNIVSNKNIGGKTVINMSPTFIINEGSRNVIGEIENYMDNLARSISYHTGSKPA